MLKVIIVGLCLLSSFSILTEHETRLFYIGKLSLNKEKAAILKNLNGGHFTGVMAEVYALIDHHKIDSLLVEPENVSFWKDSVAFSVSVPEDFTKTATEISIVPVYHVSYKTVDRGDASIDLNGDGDTTGRILLKIKSDPQKVTVYLIPKVMWQHDHRLVAYEPDALEHYIVSQGPTDVTVPLQEEYVYIALYYFHNKYSRIECRPSHLNPVDSVFLKLN